MAMPSRQRRVGRVQRSRRVRLLLPLRRRLRLEVRALRLRQLRRVLRRSLLRRGRKGLFISGIVLSHP